VLMAVDTVRLGAEKNDPGPTAASRKSSHQILDACESVIDQYELWSEFRSSSKRLVTTVDRFDQPTLGRQDCAHLVDGRSFVFGEKN